MNEQKIIASIQDFSSIFREAKASIKEDNSIVQSMKEFAVFFQNNFFEEVKKLQNEISKYCKDEFDPLNFRWSVFNITGVAHKETRWTKWLASCFDGRNGEKVARLFWRALCLSVCYSSNTNNDVENILSAEDWKRMAKDEPPKDVKPEEPIEKGRLDIVFRNPKELIVLENKLESGESGEGQFDKYAKWALKKSKGQKIGLVLLSQKQWDEKLPGGYINITYKTFSGFLRAGLKDHFGHIVKESEKIYLWPVIMTLVSIEQDLYEFKKEDVEIDKYEPSKISKLKEIDSYLHMGRGFHGN